MPAAPASGEVRDVLRLTRRGVERVCRAAVRLALERRRKVTLVDKANAPPSMVFLRQAFGEIAAEFPDVAAERVYVDAAALYLVQSPQTFDVNVTENLFGGILSELAGGLVAGWGWRRRPTLLSPPYEEVAIRSCVGFG